MHTQHMPHIMIVNRLEVNKVHFRPEGFDQIRPHSVRSGQFDQKVRPLTFRPEKFDLFTSTRDNEPTMRAVEKNLLSANIGCASHRIPLVVTNWLLQTGTEQLLENHITHERTFQPQTSRETSSKTSLEPVTGNITDGLQILSSAAKIHRLVAVN